MTYEYGKIIMELSTFRQNPPKELEEKLWRRLPKSLNMKATIVPSYGNIRAKTLTRLHSFELPT